MADSNQTLHEEHWSGTVDHGKDRRQARIIQRDGKPVRQFQNPENGQWEDTHHTFANLDPKLPSDVHAKVAPHLKNGLRHS
jgi:hypothetical protein